MSLPNFSSVAGLEVAKKFVVGLWGGGCGGVEHMTTVSISNASCFRVTLSGVESGFDNKKVLIWLQRGAPPVCFEYRTSLSTIWLQNICTTLWDIEL